MKLTYSNPSFGWKFIGEASLDKQKGGVEESYAVPRTIDHVNISTIRHSSVLPIQFHGARVLELGSLDSSRELIRFIVPILPRQQNLDLKSSLRPSSIRLSLLGR